MNSRLAGLCTLAVVASTSLTASATNTAQPTRISLPSGPGSIEGLGRSFAPSLASGTASYGVDIAVPPAAGGFGPRLSIDYDGGAGVSELGMGWHLSGVPRIRRRTENGIPRFDAADAFEVTGLGVPSDLLEVSPGFFRPEYESGAFVRVQRGAGDAWEARTKAGVVYRFGGEGFTEAEGEHVASWLLRESLDLHGHRIAYTWDTSGGYARLTKVTWNDFGDGARNEVTLAYEARPDVHTLFSDGIKKTLDARVTTIEVKHGGALVRRYEVHYGAGLHSRIASVDMVGRDGVSRLPTLSFAYTEPSFAAAGQITAMATPPGRSPSDPDVDIADLDGDGLPDLLVGKPGAFRSYVNHDGKSWRSGEDWVASSSPSVALSTSGVQLADADGDGAVDLLIKSGVGDFRYLPGRNATSFASGVAIPTALNVSFEDPDVKLADMDGDRRVDVVFTSASGLYIGYNRGGVDWSAPALVGTIDAGQALRFSDGGHTQLCDVNGDRVQDFCYLRSQSLVYWLGRGRGAFEPAQTATGVPTWDPSSPWELRDLDGDGWVDLVHVGVDQVDVALATSAGRFDAPKSITGTPYRGPNTTVRFADMNGSGTTDIVWIDVSGSPDHAWQYLELFPGGRAGLMTRIDNGLGKIETIDYAPSGLEAAASRAAGAPWTTRMNVPMPVVKRTRVDASLGDPVLTVEYDYRDGTWSGVERTFAGFGGGTQRSIGDEYTPTLLEQFVYDTGVADRTQRGLVLSHAMLDVRGRIFSRTSQTYASTTLETAPNGRAVHYTYLASSKAEAIELGDESAARTTLTEYEQDAYGNVTREAHWGEVVGDDKLAGHDERIVVRTYANNDADWILGHLSTEETQDGAGARVRMHRVYYDGAPSQGLPLGQVARGDVARSEDWAGGDAFDLVRATSYDKDGNVIETRDARGGGHIFEWASDHTSLVSEKVKLEGGTLTAHAEVDPAFGTMTKATGFNGQATTATYDAFGRVLAIVKPGDSAERPTTRFTYLPAAPLSRIVTEHRIWNGRDDVERAEDLFDGAGRRRAGLAADDGGRWVLAGVGVLDARGNVRRALRPRFASAQEHDTPPLRFDGPGVDTWRDATSRVVRTRSQLGIETRTAFAPFVTEHWNGAQNDPSSPFEHTPDVDTHDGLGRLVSHGATLGGKPLVATFAYDATGNLVQKTDPEGNVSRYTYDARGRRTLVDDPDTGKHAFVYDAASSLTEHHRPDGTVERFTFDLAGRDLISDWDGDGKPEVVFQWDHGDGDDNPLLHGMLVKVTDPSGSTVNEYDARGRHTKTHLTIDGARYELATAYDAHDREYWHQYSDGSSIRIHRNARGLVSAYGEAVTFDYDADGVETRRVFNTGVEELRGYDADRRLVEKRARRSDGAVLQDLQWSFDGAANLLAVTDKRADVSPDKSRSETYAYDNLFRLTSARGAWGEVSWGYSPSGTLTARTSSVAALNATAIEVGKGAGPHAVTRIGDRAIRYDALGRMTDDGDRAYAWDTADHLVHVANRAGATLDSVYDATGTRRVRVEKGADGAVHTTHFIDDESESRDGELVRYVVHAGRRIARLAPGNGAAQARSDTPRSGDVRYAGMAHDAPTALFVLLVLALAGARFRGHARAASLFMLAPFFVAALAAGAAVTTACSSNTDGALPILEGTIHSLSEADELLLDDAVGSLSEELSGAGTVRATFAAYPYGLTRYDTSGESRKYAGTPRDASVGLDSMGAREFAPDLGVWTSPDPLVAARPEAGMGDRFAAHNPYAYASDTPVLAVDRDGHFWHVVVATGVGAAFGALANGGAEAISQLAQNGRVDDWGKVKAKAAVGGAVGGGEAGLMVLGVPAPVAGGLSGAALGTANRYIDSKGETVGTTKEALGDAAIGTVTAGMGSAITKVAKATPAVRKPMQNAAREAAVRVQNAVCAGGRCCFVAGTLVATEDGDRPIESVRVGERVLSRDEETGALELRPVAWLKPPSEQPIVELRVRAADGVLETIRTTFEHPFWVVWRGWVRAGELDAGDVLSSDGGVVRVEAVEATRRVERVFNFEVEGTHTYFVSKARVWVHNECAPSGGGKGAEGLTPRAARRAAMREAGIPTSQQPVSQQSTRVPGTNQAGGRQYTYEVPGPGGGTQEMSVQHSLTDRVEGHGAHWEAGATKGAGRTDPLGRPRLGNDKVKVDE